MNKLVVEIVGAHENVIIDHLSLDNKMCSFFPSLVDNGNKNGINPRTYYNAVVKSDDSSKRKRIEATLPSLGKVELYLEKNIDAKNDRIAFFRLPCMLVMRRSSSQLKLNINNYGVYGVFVCVNSSGDKKLKELENPAHDEWSEKNWRNAVTNKIEPKATEYMEELRSFIAEEIEKFCKKKNAASLKMLGAGKYLYTVQDMVEGDDDTDVVGPSTKGFFEINTIAEHPTGARTAVVNEDVDIKVPENHSGRRSGNVTNMKGKATAVSRDEKPGGVTVLVTPPTKPKNKTQKKNVGGAKPVSANPSDKTAATIVPIEYKVYANKENGRIVHNICISSTENVEDALIKFISKREDGRTDEELEIVDSYCQGTFQGMELHHVRLMAGDNMLKIRFNDNIKHVLYINITLK